MIKLQFDIQCGYRDLYLTEKDAEFPLDVLFSDATKAAYSAMGLRMPDSLGFASAEEMLYAYSKDPEGLMEALNLPIVLRAVTEAEYGKGLFARLCPTRSRRTEFFALSNCRICIVPSEVSPLRQALNELGEAQKEEQPAESDISDGGYKA